MVIISRAFSPYKYDIGQILIFDNQKLEITNREYRSKTKYKNKKPYISNIKYYQYKCLKCGNEDWISEYMLNNNCGCNSCCKSPKKVLKGVNDVATTEPWILHLLKNKEDAYTYHKYSKKELVFICPHCGREHIKPLGNVVANRGITCICNNNMSYPNKFMYYLLETNHVDFESEKVFTWSDNRRYDFYISNQISVIIELNGKQHYDKPIIKSSRYRTSEEEYRNDLYKMTLAKQNGIDHYFQINCSKSNKEFIKTSIINSGLLDLLGINYKEINWDLCDYFASFNNIIKEICDLKHNNPEITLHMIAQKYKLSYKTVLSYIKIGNKFGWCNYKIGDDLAFLNANELIDHGQKPIYCVTNNCCYKSAKEVENILSTPENKLYSRQIRNSIQRGSKYKGYEFKYITC